MSPPRRSRSLRLWVARVLPPVLILSLTLPTGAAFAEPRPPAALVTEADTATQRRHELDDLHRQDLSAQLAQRGVALKWQDHTLVELTDWRDRIDAAYALHAQYGVDVDWRVTSLRSLTDMRLRAAKAAELSNLYDVRVDWRRYSWVALESLRRNVAGLQGAKPPAPGPADALATPGSVGQPRRLGFRPTDPDAIIEPTFAFDSPPAWARPLGRRGVIDPDAILVPSFVSVPTPPLGRDDIINPWRSERSSGGDYRRR